jgi:hypothetical protein
MEWPGFDPKSWEKLLAEQSPLPGAHLPGMAEGVPRLADGLSEPTENGPQTAGGLPIILASDRDAGAIQIAQANAERAGVAGQIDFSSRAVSAIDPPPAPAGSSPTRPTGSGSAAPKTCAIHTPSSATSCTLAALAGGWRS